VKHPAPAAQSQPTSFAATAHKLGISVAQLQNGLFAAKRAGGNSAGGIVAFARAAGVSRATAQRAITAVFGAPPENPGMATGSAAAALAHGLGISNAAAVRVLHELDRLNGPNGVDPQSSGFAAIARQLGVTPARLAGALDQMKRALVNG
jgi:hypothetical protein